MPGGLINDWKKKQGPSLLGYIMAAPSSTTVAPQRPSTGTTGSIDSLVIALKDKLQGLSQNINAPKFNQFIVAPGSSMWAIAKENNIGLDELIAANPQIKTPSLIRAGERINVPNKKYTPFTKTVVSSKDLDKIIGIINKSDSDSAKIVNYHKLLPASSNFSLVNKSANKIYTYSPDGNIINEKEILSGGINKDTRNFNSNVYDEKTKKEVIANIPGAGMDEGVLRSWTTPAGIFTVSNKHTKIPEGDKSYNANGINFANERGVEQGMSVHTPASMSRYKFFENNNQDDNRRSQGCINIRPDDFTTIYNQMPKGAKMYVLPEEKTGKMTIDNYNLRYVPTEEATEFDLKNNYYSPLRSNTADYSVDYANIKPEFRQYLQNIEDNKENIKKQLNINDDTYTKLLRVTYGILVNESGSGGVRKAIKSLIPDNPFIWKDPKRFRSRGLGQIKYGYLPETDAKKFGITPDNLSGDRHNSLAMMVALLDKYKTIQSKLKKNKINDQDVNSLLMYAYNRPEMLDHMDQMGDNRYVKRGLANLTPMRIPIRVYQ